MTVPLIPTMAERVRASNPGASAVLALDLGTKTGVAICHVDGRVSCSTVLFDNRGGYGYRFLRFRHWLTETKNAAGGFNAVYYEEVMFAGARGQTQKGAQLYGGFKATLTAWCEHHRVRYCGIHNATIKKFWTGSGRADKAMMIEAARIHGFDPGDDNQADALALLHLGLERMAGARDAA